MSVIPIFLVWLYWLWIIVLLGAEIAFICDYAYHISQNELFQFNPMWPILILLKILENFHKEKRRLNNIELSKELNLPLDTINLLTNQLVKYGWIIRSEKETWLPNCPLESLSLGEIVSINKEFDKIDGISIDKIEMAWHQLERCLHKEWNSITLGSLIDHEGPLNKRSA